MRVGKGLDVQLDRVVGRKRLKKGFEQYIWALAGKERRHMKEPKNLAVLCRCYGLGILGLTHQMVEPHRNDQNRLHAARVS